METINKIDDMLENFVGIRDQELSTTVFDLAKAAKEAEVFASGLDEKLTDFEFPDDFVLDVSDCRFEKHTFTLVWKEIAVKICRLEKHTRSALFKELRECSMTV